MYSDELLPELRLRWARVRGVLKEAGADGVLLSTSANLYYVSGRVFRGYAYVPAEGDPLFFVRRPLGLSGPRVRYIKRPDEVAAGLAAEGLLPAHPALEADALPYSEYLRMLDVLGVKTAANGSQLMRRARSVKTPFEIEKIRRSGVLHARVYERVPEIFREGMTDLELSVEIERLLRLGGSLGIFRIAGSSMEIFMGSLLAGANADAPSPYDFALGGAGLDASLPVGADGTRLVSGTAVMVDMGGNFTGYMTDMTRVFAVGELPGEAYRAHETALAIQRTVENTARPGTPAAALYEAAVQIASEAGFAPNFMGHRQQAGFIGHGVGIEINEAPVLAPRSKEVLEPGMVFALEPKFVLPGVGAVGIENTYVVTASGVEKLTLCDESIRNLCPASPLLASV